MSADIGIEIAVDSVTGAIAAERAGAHRIELCQSLHEGGLTPSLGLVEAVVNAVTIPVVAMLRPRGGDFLFDDNEFDTMRRDAAHLRRSGVAGIVTGALTEDGHVDRDRMRRLVEMAEGLAVTCHRAFDLLAEPLAAIDQLCDLSVARVLTSGQARCAITGMNAIRTLQAHAGDRIDIIAGAGVRDDNVAELVRATGVRWVHLSASRWRDSDMQFRRPNVPMGATAPPDEYRLRSTDGALVERVAAALRRR